jgi:hypothetical protein
VRVLRLTTLRGVTAIAPSPAHGGSARGHDTLAADDQADDQTLYDLALLASPEELRAKRLGSIGEALRDFWVAREACRSAGLIDGAGLTKSVARLLAGTEAVAAAPGLLAGQLGRWGRRLTEQAVDDPTKAGQASRITEAGRLCGFCHDRFGKRGVSEARLFREGLRQLSEHPVVLSAEQIDLEGLHLTVGHVGTPSLPAWLGVLEMLAHPERPLRVLLPSVEDRPPLQRALKPLLDGLYRRHELPIEEETCPLGPLAVDEGPWARFVRGLFRPRGQSALVTEGELDGQLSLSPQPSPSAEAQAVTAKVLQLLTAGVAADRIAIVAESAERRGRVTEALLRAGVTTTPLRGGVAGARLRPVELPPPLRLIAQLFEVLALGLPREGLIQLLTNRYLRFPGSLAAEPWLLSRALRAAGVRSLRRPERAKSAATELWDAATSPEPTWGLSRLRIWLTAQCNDDGTPKARAAHVPLVIEQAELALRELSSLPTTGLLSEHVLGLLRLLSRLHYFELSSSLPKLPSGDDSVALAELVTQALAARERDVAAVELLRHALAELPQWARRLGVGSESLSQREFAGLLKQVLGRLWDEQLRATKTMAVQVGELADVPPRTFEHLLIAGLLEGELPAFRPEDSLLSDDDRRLLERLADRPLWPQAQHASDAEPLKLAVALAHTASAHLFWPLADEEGRPIARSPFVDEIMHAAAWPEQPLPRLSSDEKPMVRLAELWQQSQQRPALLSSLTLRDRRRAARILSLVQIEEQRTRFFGATFANAEAAGLHSHPFVGRLLDEGLIGVLQPRLPGSPSHPLSASVLEDYARCPFRFFARRVLQIRPEGEGGEELDPLASGRLHHAVLEMFFKDRQASERLPVRADEDDRTALDRAIEQVVSDFVRREHVGHPELLKVRLGRLRTELWRLIEHEAKEPPEPGCLPALFEWKFGPLAIASVHGDDHKMALHIHGIIDRVDLGDGKALVLDYKAGRRERYQSQLNDKLLQTSFQLPLYVAALRADPKLNADKPLQSVVARYYSLRQGRVTTPLDNPTMTTLDPAERLRNPDGNVAEVAYHLWRRLRDGDFAVAPRTCEGCGLESVCRISAAPLDPPSDATESSQSSQASQTSAPSQLSPPADFVDGDNR